MFSNDLRDDMDQCAQSLTMYVHATASIHVVSFGSSVMLLISFRRCRRRLLETELHDVVGFAVLHLLL